MAFGQADNAGQTSTNEAADKSGEVLFNDVANELRCPTCTGLSVLGSEANFSVQIKNQVREQLDAGKSKSEILAYFTERYGPWILREPPKEGFNLLAWLLPAALLVLGPIILWFTVWRHRAQFDSHGVRSVEAIQQEMDQRLEQLRKGGSAS
jgi:cytochrome c-type biogenesis protein CcmH